MKKTLIWLLSLMTLAVVLGIAVVSMSPHGDANARVATDFIVPQIAQPNIASEIEPQKVNLTDQVNALTEKWTGAHKKAGWLHVVAHQVQESDTQNIAPDGSVAPNEFIMEDWVLLDDNGHEIMGVFLQRNLDGAVIQASILKDGFWHNLTYGGVTPAPENLMYVFDFGFSSIAVNSQSGLKKTEISRNGRPFESFTVEEKYADPVEILGFKAKVSAIEVTAFFNVDGMVEVYQTIVTLEDGTRRISSSVEVQIFQQDVKPPAEIMNYLSPGA